MPKLKFCSDWQETLEKQKLNFFHCGLFHMKTKVSLKYFVRYVVVLIGWITCTYVHDVSKNAGRF